MLVWWVYFVYYSYIWRVWERQKDRERVIRSIVCVRARLVRGCMWEVRDRVAEGAFLRTGEKERRREEERESVCVCMCARACLCPCVSEKPSIMGERHSLQGRVGAFTRDRVQHKHLKSQLDMQKYVSVEFKCVLTCLLAIPPFRFFMRQ